MFFKGSSELDNVGFYRLSGGELRLADPAPGGRRGRVEVVLASLRTLSLADFSFPFGNVLKVREALKLQILPYATAGAVELFPTTLTHSGRSSQGVVWYLSGNELELPQGEAGTDRRVWPAPLALVSGLPDGTGVTLWADEESFSGLLWQEGRPVLTRWCPRSSGTSESALEWFDAYCREAELDRGGSFVLDASNPGDLLTLGRVARESLKLCPWLASVNLSLKALVGAMDLERSVRLLTRAACWLFLMGALVLAGNLLKSSRDTKSAEQVRSRSEALYREVFDPERKGRISNPVTLARDRIAELQTGSSEGRRLQDALTDLGDIFQENPSLDVTLDVLRYNSEGLDCTGSAPDMTTVLAFRKAWEGRSSLSQLDNTQSVAGVGYRFDLRVRW